MPRPPRERTLLERVHAWKRGLRANIRRSLRAQFTESPSAHLGRMQPAEPPKAGSRETHYAEAPVLNQQQLVLSFVQPVRAHSRWERETVPLGVKDKGVYLVEAVRGELRAYTILMVSDIVMVTKSAKGRIVNLVVDRATGEPVSAAKLWTVTRDGRKCEADTDADGVAEIKLAAAKPADIRLVARRGGDYAVNALSEYAFGANVDQWMGYHLHRPSRVPPGPHRPFQRHSATADGERATRRRRGKPVSVEIHDRGAEAGLSQDADGERQRDDSRRPGAAGASAALGNYFIEVQAGEYTMSGDFEVEEYKKPEYEVRVTPAKSRVLQGESVQAVIDSRYYFGEPVSGAQGEVRGLSRSLLVPDVVRPGG